MTRRYRVPSALPSTRVVAQAASPRAVRSQGVASPSFPIGLHPAVQTAAIPALRDAARVDGPFHSDHAGGRPAVKRRRTEQGINRRPRNGPQLSTERERLIPIQGIDKTASRPIVASLPVL